MVPRGRPVSFMKFGGHWGQIPSATVSFHYWHWSHWDSKARLSYLWRVRETYETILDCTEPQESESGIGELQMASGLWPQISMSTLRMARDMCDTIFFIVLSLGNPIIISVTSWWPPASNLLITSWVQKHIWHQHLIVLGIESPNILSLTSRWPLTFSPMYSTVEDRPSE